MVAFVENEFGRLVPASVRRGRNDVTTHERKDRTVRNSSPILVLGSVNVDLVTRGTRLPVAGETVIGAEFFQAAGGKGANQAVAAARLSNGAVTLVAAVGDDPFGRQSLDRFRDENLVVDYIKTVPNSPTGVALIMVDQHGENCISVASGANRDLSPEDVAVIPDAVFQSARVFLTCLESPWSTVAAGLQRARSAGLTTILNPAPASAELAGHPMLRDVDIVTPNEGEAEQLTGTHLDRDHSLQTAAQRLRQAGVGDVVFTLGVRGAAIFDGSLTSLPASASEVVDTTAAGDAFNGALAVGLAEGKSLQQAVQRAIVAAGISVSRSGAQPSLPTRAEVASRIDQSVDGEQSCESPPLDTV
ncbi:MAG: ribokinase [Planctomycetaceae bacterium]|nr:ribokinase [Planctomycetaceae bacterium]